MRIMVVTINHHRKENRMKISRMIAGMILVLIGLSFSGCLKVDEVKIHYHITPDMTGSMTLEFMGIGSDEKTLAEQKKEMKKFFDEEYLMSAEEQITGWCLKNGKVELTDKTDISTNARVTGTIENLPGSLYPLTEGKEYEMKRSGNHFSINIPSVGISEKDCPVTVFIKYDGNIVSHNAHRFIPGSRTMIWSGTKMEKTGIRFKIKTK